MFRVRRLSQAWCDLCVAGEWIAPVVTGTVGVVGIAATWSAQHLSRKHAADLARRGRTQDRRQAAYERILLTALKTTEFVQYADLIWVRNAEPPDVDVQNYDMWVLTALHTTDGFRAAYRRWIDAVDATRAIADDLEEDQIIWDQPGDLPDRYRASAEAMRERYDELVQVARTELDLG